MPPGAKDTRLPNGSPLKEAEGGGEACRQPLSPVHRASGGSQTSLASGGLSDAIAVSWKHGISSPLDGQLNAQHLSGSNRYGVIVSNGHFTVSNI